MIRSTPFTSFCYLSSSRSAMKPLHSVSLSDVYKFLHPCVSSIKSLSKSAETHPNVAIIALRISSDTMSLIPSFLGGRRSGVFDPFSLDVWDPFEGFGVVAAAQPPVGDREATAIANARIDWKETPEAHVFKVDLPGVKKSEVKVEVEDGRVLQISGERRREKEEKTDKWHRVERSSGRFMRRFRLPENVKLDEVRASMENGELTVVVPKAEEKKPEVKAIDIGGGGE